MDTLHELARHYYDLNVYTFPSTHPYSWLEWRNKNLAERTFASFNWEGADHLNGIAGIKGVRAIKINIEGLDENMLWSIVIDSIKLLNLEMYPWIVRYLNALYIIVESEDTKYTFDIPKYEYAEIIWRDSFPLPSVNSYPAKFYFKGIPGIPPKHVDNNVLFDYVDTINNFITQLKEEEIEGENNHSKQLLKELGVFGSKSYIEKQKAKEAGLTVEQFRIYEKKAQSLLVSYKKQLELKEKRKNVISKFKNIGEGILCLLVFVGINLLWIGPLIDKSFEDLLKPIIAFVGIIILCYLFIMLITPFYLVIDSLMRKSNIPKFIRVVLNVICSTIIIIVILVLIYFVGSSIGIIHI